MSNNPKAEEYILAETHEKGFVFQIICISGQRAGGLFGYVQEDPMAVEDRVRGVSPEHLLSEVQRNFIYAEDSFEVVLSRLSPR